jgi:hypothetical protein
MEDINYGTYEICIDFGFKRYKSKKHNIRLNVWLPEKSSEVKNLINDTNKKYSKANKSEKEIKKSLQHYEDDDEDAQSPKHYDYEDDEDYLYYRTPKEDDDYEDTDL